LLLRKDSLTIHLKKPSLSMGSISIFAMFLAVFTSGHVVTSDALGLRLELQALLLLVIILSISGSIRNNFKTIDLCIFSLVLSFVIGEIIFRGELYEVIGHLLTFALAFVALSINRRSLIKFIDFFNNFNVLMCVLAIAGVYFAVNNLDVLKVMMERPELYSRESLNSKNIYLLLGNIDTENTVLGVSLPRVNSYLQQASLLPAYFLLPLGMALAYSQVSKTKIIILISFMILAFGGNVIVGIMSACLLFLFRRFVPASIYLIFPFVVLGLITALLMIFFYDEIVREGLSKDNMRALGGVQSQTYYQTLGVGEARAGSGLVRLIFIVKQFANILASNFLPADSEMVDLSLGSALYTNTLLGRAVALILSLIIYTHLFRICISGFRDRSLTKNAQFGFCIIYAVLFQAIAYNDFGFGTYFALMMFCIIIKLSRDNEKLKPIL